MPDFLVPALALAIFVLVPLRGWLSRGRTYGIFGGVTLAVSLPGVVGGHARLSGLLPETPVDLLFVYGLVAAAVHLAHLARPRMRSNAFRLGISVPGQTLIAAGFGLGVWWLCLLPLRGLFWIVGWDLAPLGWLDLFPVAVAVASIATSAQPRGEVVRVTPGDHHPKDFERLPLEREHRRLRAAPVRAGADVLRIAQITDPHLGPWQTVASLRGIVEELLSQDPHLVLLTGDFLTMESRGSPDALARALEPLRDARDRCFAAFGNHDHEAPEVVRTAMRANGVQLLVDDAATTTTPAGAVQIVGADYVRREREQHLKELLTRFPRVDDHLRLLLLHDPSAFHDLPADEVDLVLSGHTHGGQLGLVSLGLDWTVLSRSRWPDHGYFGRGRSRLYVHRGTGFYGFPLRVGVPGELSILEVSRA